MHHSEYYKTIVPSTITFSPRQALTPLASIYQTTVVASCHPASVLQISTTVQWSSRIIHHFYFNS